MRNLSKKYAWASAIAALALIVAGATALALGGKGDGLWLSAGQNNHNTRNQALESKIGLDNVADLAMKWVADTGGGEVSATPAVDGNAVYFPAWDGFLYKVDKKTGAVIWKRSITSYTGVFGDFARTTPAVVDNLLVFGDQAGRGALGFSDGARVLAVNKKTGDLVWSTVVDSHPGAIITQSAVVHANTVYVGVSSFEELLAAFPGYTCCTFRGSVVALDLDTGEIKWKTFMAPAPTGDPLDGFTGNAVWGSTPVVDTSRGSLYVSTGNNYTAPASVQTCVQDVYDAGGDEDDVRACFAAFPDNYFDAMVALDLKTGEVKWANTVLPFDSWNVGCFVEILPLPWLIEDNCPEPSGPDFDFGQGPTLLTVEIGGKPRDLVGAGQKSGIYWALDADTGDVVWSTQVGPGGVAGGMQWGSAYDGERIYAAISNIEGTEWTPLDGTPITYGAWSALNPATGEILWQTADPNGVPDQAALTVANGVVYAGSLSSAVDAGTFNALDAETGEIVWSFASGSEVNAGPAVVNGVVYWGTGYTNVPGNGALYAFKLPKGK